MRAHTHTFIYNILMYVQMFVKGKFLYSAVSSPQDCSKHFTHVYTIYLCMYICMQKVSSYIAQYPVIRTAQSTLQFVYFSVRPVQSNTVSTSLGNIKLHRN